MCIIRLDHVPESKNCWDGLVVIRSPSSRRYRVRNGSRFDYDSMLRATVRKSGIDTRRGAITSRTVKYWCSGANAIRAKSRWALSSRMLSCAVGGIGGIGTALRWRVMVRIWVGVGVGLWSDAAA